MAAPPLPPPLPPTPAAAAAGAAAAPGAPRKMKLEPGAAPAHKSVARERGRRTVTELSTLMLL